MSLHDTFSQKSIKNNLTITAKTPIALPQHIPKIKIFAENLTVAPETKFDKNTFMSTHSSAMNRNNKAIDSKMLQNIKLNLSKHAFTFYSCIQNESNSKLKKVVQKRDVETVMVPKGS